ncbi:hypothetical protein SANTM175S_06837 [Streptomyces antimycoticus]
MSASRGEEARRRLEALSAGVGGARALGEGLSNADARERIPISEATVKTYVSRFLTTLHHENRVRRRRRHGTRGWAPRFGAVGVIPRAGPPGCPGG